MPLINYSESGVSQEGRRHFHDSDFIVQQRLRSSTNFPNETLEPKRRQNHYEVSIRVCVYVSVCLCVSVSNCMYCRISLYDKLEYI